MVMEKSRKHILSSLWEPCRNSCRLCLSLCTFRYCFNLFSLCGFQDSRQSLGVRMALGETQIVAETKQFLIDNGVSLDAFGQVKKKTFLKITYFIRLLTG